MNLGEPTLVFLDTEFSSLQQTAPALLSLALVSEDGAREWYAEMIDGWRLEDCHPFVVDNVLPLFTGPKLKRASARRSLTAWIKQFEQPVTFACDWPMDFKLALELLGNPPDNLTLDYYDLALLLDVDVYSATVNRYYTQTRPPHHALYDAQANRLGWLAWREPEDRTRNR
jgi:hypothetical protein